MKNDIRPLRVFLCHASGDKPAVIKLYDRLIKDGIDAWLDKEKLIPGQNWQIEIPKAVRNSDVVIVCLSSQSINKEGFVQKEIKIALDTADEKPEGTIFIIPARLENCNIPERISQYHCVDLFSDNGYEWLLKALYLRANTIGSEIIPVKLSPDQKIPDNSKFLELVALADSNTDFKRKLELYEDALSIENHSDIHRKAAWCALCLNDYSLAREHDQKAVNLDPNNIHSWVGLVVAGSYLRDRTLIEKAFDEVQKRADSDSDYYVEAAYYFGQYLYHTGQRKEARPYLNKVVQSDFQSKYFMHLRQGAANYLSNI